MTGRNQFLVRTAAHRAYNAYLKGLVPILAPGAGWGGVSTDVPADRGDSGAVTYGNKIIANFINPQWDETKTATMNIGWLMFQAPTAEQYAAGIRNAVEYSEISIDGGTWMRVDVPQVEPNSGVRCYYASVVPSLFPDGMHEARVRCYPLIGKCRVLQGPMGGQAVTASLFFFTNYNNSLAERTMYVDATLGNDANAGTTVGSPCATIDAAGIKGRALMPGNDCGGLRIECAAGDHVLNAVNTTQRLSGANRWMTITHQPGVTRDQCRLIGYSKTKIQRIKIVDVTKIDILQGESSGTLKTTGAAWTDNCIMYSSDPNAKANTDTLSNQPIYAGRFDIGVFCTNCEIYNWGNATQGFWLVRGCNMHDIGSDTLFICKVAVKNIVGYLSGGSGFHPDVYQVGVAGQFYENFILCDLVADCYPGILVKDGNGFKDFAFVNITKTGGTVGRIEMQLFLMENLFVLNMNMVTSASVLNYENTMVSSCWVDCQFTPDISQPGYGGARFLGVT